MRIHPSYKAGEKAFKRGTSYKKNPHRHGTIAWQAWLNGHGDAGDEQFLKCLKKNPSMGALLMGS